MADHSIKVIIKSATEITDKDELASLFALRKDLVTIAIKEGSFTNEDAEAIPEPDPDFKGEKSVGQRIRAVMYRWWEQKGKPQEFELFYKIQGEKIINSIKEKLI